MFDYVNLIYWLIALASLVAWARFATFLANDVSNNLIDQPELPWKLGTAAVFVLMLIMYIVPVPSFWVSFAVSALIAGGMIGAFWAVRVKTLGSKGHLFSGAIQSAVNVSKGMEERKNARQVQLTYLRHDNTPMPLPAQLLTTTCSRGSKAATKTALCPPSEWPMTPMREPSTSGSPCRRSTARMWFQTPFMVALA